MKLKLVVLVLLWVACGLMNWGFTLGYFTHHYPWEDNRGVAAFTALGGPIAVPASMLQFPHYWRWVPMTPEERWQAYHEQWPSLSRKDFDQSMN